MREENKYSFVSLEEAKKLIKLAREAIKRKEIKKGSGKRAAVFVTLNKYPNGELRGCIGFTEAIYPIEEAVQRAAIGAAFEDPRFWPLNEDEIEKVTIELSILTPAKECKLEDIKRGDGVIIECGFRKALFLPQVWEELPSKEEFLSALCQKAGLPINCWENDSCKFYKFSVEAYKEKKPNGEVERVI